MLARPYRLLGFKLGNRGGGGGGGEYQSKSSLLPEECMLTVCSGL